jgi:hypothetical protein
MNNMKLAILMILALATAVCYAGDFEEQAAPSGEFLVRADVPTSEVSPSFRLRVRLIFIDIASKKEFPVYTGASDRWAITWTAANVLVLFATKNEDGVSVHAFEMQKKKVVERAASEAEEKMSRQAYDRKYQK